MANYLAGSLHAAPRSDRGFNDPPSDDDDGNRQPDEWEDCDAWPPDDLDLELDDEPEPEPAISGYRTMTRSNHF